MVASKFVSTLEVTDLRYDLAWYGAFLKDIPRRLGSNDALDASVSALTVAHPSLHTRQKSPEIFVKYGKALKALRTCLNDPIKARTVETLCAIYLIIICQGWIGSRDDRHVGHGEAMAHILNAGASQNWRDVFGAEMLITLCVPVIIESVFNPKIQLNPELLELTETYGPPRPIDRDDRIPIQSLKLKSLAKMPDFVRNPELHLVEIKFSYQQVRAELPKLGQRLAKMVEPTSLGVIQAFSVPIVRLYAHLQSAYGILLALAIILNGMLRAYNPHDSHLGEESGSFVNEVMTLAENVLQHRPLGGSYIPICLVPAWAATDDTSKRAELEKLLLEYQTDFAHEGWMDWAAWLKNKYESLRLKVLTSHLC